MTDSQMIALFWDRNEDAIQETDRAYGRKLFVLFDKILHSHQDAEESVIESELFLAIIHNYDLSRVPNDQSPS